MSPVDPDPSRRIPTYPAREPDETIESWATMSTTALAPGWRNIYEGGRPGELIIEAAPAMLHQELAQTTERWKTSRDDDPDSSVRIQSHKEQPRETRVLFARHERGRLSPAEDSTNTYLGACGPGEDATGMYG
jgi:hypothetical protein